MTTAPFRLPGDDRGVLLVHGLAGSPYAMRFLGEKLHARGFTVFAPALPEKDGWLAAVEAEMAALRERCSRIAVAGLSLGGLLALRLAEGEADLRAIAILSAPLWLPLHIHAAVTALSRLETLFGPVPDIPNFGGSDIRDPEAKRTYPSPVGFPIASLAALLRLQAGVRADLPKVRVPTLVIHGDHDHTAPPAGAREILRRIGATDKKLVRLPLSFHIVTLDVERDLVAAAVGDFFAERM